MELPLAYINEMKALLGVEYEDYLASFEEVRLYGLRANTLKISPAELAEKGEFSLSPVPVSYTHLCYKDLVRALGAKYQIPIYKHQKLRTPAELEWTK